MSARHTPLTRSRTAAVGVGALALVALGPLASTAWALPAPAGATLPAPAPVPLALTVPTDLLPTGALPAPVAGPVGSVVSAVDGVTVPVPAPSSSSPTDTPPPGPVPVPPLPGPLTQTPPTTTPPTATPPTAPPAVPGTPGAPGVPGAAAPVGPATTGGGTAVVQPGPVEGAGAVGGSSVALLPAGNFGAVSPRALEAAASAPLLPGLAGPLEAAAAPELAGPQVAGPLAAPRTADLALSPRVPASAQLPGLIVIVATVAVGSAAAAHVGVLQNRAAARASS